ncbi:MAG: Methyltransferase type 11 [Parcubacteria group bacterium GW2011_GWD2_38_11]|nr:MAG: Methyltransferase type 11 [Parcubacteria group bacterium GW2011_GWD2_38_11]
MEETQNQVGKFLDPDAIIAQLDVVRGGVVVDFGCGPGYFSIPFAKAVGKDGRVYSLDVLPQALETVTGKAKNSGVANIITKRVNLEKEGGTKLEENSADWVVLKDVLFQNKKKEIIIAEAYRVLKSGGRVIAIEWNQKDSGVGPAADIRVPQIALEKMFGDQKFIVEKNIEAGDFHYAFVAVK